MRPPWRVAGALSCRVLWSQSPQYAPRGPGGQHGTVVAQQPSPNRLPASLPGPTRHPASRAPPWPSNDIHHFVTLCNVRPYICKVCPTPPCRAPPWRRQWWPARHCWWGRGSSFSPPHRRTGPSGSTLQRHGLQCGQQHRTQPTAWQRPSTLPCTPHPASPLPLDLLNPFFPTPLKPLASIQLLLQVRQYFTAGYYPEGRGPNPAAAFMPR
jgi:hypothetical protein